MFENLLLFQVSANTENSSMSGYLYRSKGNKKQWKRLWFVIKNKVLYTYAASEVTLTAACNAFAVLKLFALRSHQCCLPSGRCCLGEPAPAGFLPERGEKRTGSEAAVQAVSQKYTVLHVQSRRHPHSTEVRRCTPRSPPPFSSSQATMG